MVELAYPNYSPFPSVFSAEITRGHRPSADGARAPARAYELETESRKRPKQVKATITASIQYWERAAIR